MLQLVQAFTALDNHELRRSLVELIERIAKRNKRTGAPTRFDLPLPHPRHRWAVRVLHPEASLRSARAVVEVEGDELPSPITQSRKSPRSLRIS